MKVDTSSLALCGSMSELPVSSAPLTVTLQFAEAAVYPFAASAVAVMYAVPSLKAVTRPSSPTVATAVFEHE